LVLELPVLGLAGETTGTIICPLCVRPYLRVVEQILILTVYLVTLLALLFLLLSG
jgi:hypothetical protein